MKRTESVLAFFLALIVAAAAFGARAEAADAVYDNAKLLTRREKDALVDNIHRIENKYGVRIGVVTTPSVQGRHIGRVANAILDEAYRGAPHGGMVLLISMDERQWYISTDTKMQLRITDEEGIPYIADRMVPHLKNGDYFKGLTEYVSAIEYLLGRFFG